MSDPSMSKAASPRRGGGSTAGGRRSGLSAPEAHPRSSRIAGVARILLVSALVLAGIAWIATYINVARDGQELSWMGDLGRWNYLIGFGAILLGLTLAAHPSTPLGRGRGVVVGMLGCFLLGLVWILVYYVTGTMQLPLVTDLAQYNLMVGIGFMAVGFVYATHWE